MRVALTFFFWMVWNISFSQGTILTTLLETTPSSENLYQKRLTGFIEELKAKKGNYRSEVRYFKKVVNKSHKKFLRNYKAYSQFNEVLEVGNYDCLSGTAFFSVVLGELGFSYKIIETNYHIFLLIDTPTKQLLLETTDRIAGIKTNAKDVERSLLEYRQNQLVANSNTDKYYRYQANLFREVNPLQLSGLLFFNQAVVAYNQHNWVLCADRLERARSIYNNERVEELSELLIGSIALSSLTEEKKNELMLTLKKYLKLSPAVATR
jgi:hypothetical protein